MRSGAMLKAAGRRWISTAAVLPSISVSPAVASPSPLLPLPMPEDEVEILQHRLRHTFTNRALLEDALTHPSYPHRRPAQRHMQKPWTSLKLLGEQSLRCEPECYGNSPDLLRINLCPHKIANIAIRLNLYSFLRHNSPKIDLEVEEYINAQVGEVPYSGSVLKVPKVLPDLVYSLFGAILVDCNALKPSWSTKMAWQSMKLHFQPIYFWQDIVNVDEYMQLSYICLNHNLSLSYRYTKDNHFHEARLYISIFRHGFAEGKKVLHGFGSSTQLSRSITLATCDVCNKLPRYILDGTMFSIHPKRLGSLELDDI